MIMGFGTFGSPLVIDQTAFVGSLLYDYSMADTRLRGVLSMDAYEKGVFCDPANRVWNLVRLRTARVAASQKEHVWFRRRKRRSSPAIAEQLMDQFEQDLRATLPQAKRLVRSHSYRSVPRMPAPDRPSRSFRAYQGCLRMGKRLAEVAPHIPVTCLCGHKHRPYSGTVEGVQVLRSPLGYLDSYRGELRDKAIEHWTAGALGIRHRQTGARTCRQAPAWGA